MLIDNSLGNMRSDREREGRKGRMKGWFRCQILEVARMQRRITNRGKGARVYAGTNACRGEITNAEKRKGYLAQDVAGKY